MMDYAEIEKGQRIKIVTTVPKINAKGVVIDKEISTRGGQRVERVYINDEHGKRRLCSPSVLEPVND